MYPIILRIGIIYLIASLQEELMKAQKFYNEIQSTTKFLESLGFSVEEDIQGTTFSGWKLSGKGNAFLPYGLEEIRIKEVPIPKWVNNLEKAIRKHMDWPPNLPTVVIHN